MDQTDIQYMIMFNDRPDPKKHTADSIWLCSGGLSCGRTRYIGNAMHFSMPDTTLIPEIMDKHFPDESYSVIQFVVDYQFNSVCNTR